jgi:hypothetical protein
MGNQISPPASVIYFKESSGTMAKSLGMRVRDQGAMTRLVWSRLFKGEESIIENAQAIVIEDGCPGAAKIAVCYERFAHDVEIHYVDEEGNFIEEPDYIREQRQGHPTLPGEAIDPRAAIANLAASSAKPPAPAPEEPPADEPGDDDAVSDEELLAEVEDIPADRIDGGDQATESDSGLRGEEISEEDDIS